MRNLPVTAVLALGTFACTYADEEPAPPPAEPAMATPEDMTVYMDLVDRIDGATRDYAAAISSSELTASSCFAAHATYDATARPANLRLIGLGDKLDTFLTAHEGGFSADLACSTRLMLAELDDHSHTACMWPDVEHDRADAYEHLTSMVGFVDHLLERADEMRTGMSGTGWNWHPMACN